MATRLKTPTTQDRTFNTRIELAEDTRRQMIESLNQHLADLFDLSSQVKQSHWNVEGKDFYQLHKLFDELAEQLLELVDLVAERATALGGYATGTARMAAASSRLPEIPTDINEGMEYVQALTERYAAVGGTVRQAIDEADEAGDMGTSDLFTEVVRVLDKHLYFLEAHLQA